MNKSKLLLGMGISSLTFIPVISVVSCSLNKSPNLEETKVITLSNNELIDENEEVKKWNEELVKKQSEILGFDINDIKNKNKVNFTVERKIYVLSGSLMSSSGKNKWGKNKSNTISATFKEGELIERKINGIVVENEEEDQELIPDQAGSGGATIRIICKVWNNNVE